MLLFNKPHIAGNELKYLAEAIKTKKLSGDGPFTKKCHKWFEDRLPGSKALLTTSCTHALEMSALLCDIRKGDEVIMPSYTFSSTANAFVLRGAKIIFLDIRPDTMNIDEKLIESAITKKTKAIIPVHYAGVSCEMDYIMDLAKNKKLSVVEDAAQSLLCSYKGRALGSIGDFGCFSFHESKNINCGEGGCMIVNNLKYAEKAEIIREKGTNRSKFFRGEIDKYTWCGIGSSYLPSELNAAFLLAQLEDAENAKKNRLKSWKRYRKSLSPLWEKGQIDIQDIPEYCDHNAHMFYIKVENAKELIAYLYKNGVHTVFHYIPLHSAPMGKTAGVFKGKDRFTTKESSRLIRLPMNNNLLDKEIDKVVSVIFKYYKNK